MVPLSTLSDRLRVRRGFLIALALVLRAGVGTLGLVAGALILLVAALTGSAFDSLMALQQTTIMEVDGVDNSLSGSALGMSRPSATWASPSRRRWATASPFMAPACPSSFGRLRRLAALMFFFVFSSANRKTR